MCTNINKNITNKTCASCRHINIYLAIEDILYCTNENNVSDLSDKYYVDLTFVCPCWDGK